VLGVIVSFIVF